MLLRNCLLLLSACWATSGVPVEDAARDSTTTATGVPVEDAARDSTTTASEDKSQPKISYSRETSVVQGEDVAIDCGVEGIDLSGVEGFTITWSKIDLEKPTSSFPISKGSKVELFTSKYEIHHPKDTYQYSLKIKSAEDEDTGTYRCTVHFGFNQRIDADVPVVVQKPAYFIDPSTKTLSVTLGDSLSVECSPGGNPKPGVHWEMMLDDDLNQTSTIIESSTLAIAAVGRHHAGRYACHADNGVGQPARSDIVLAVEHVPEVSVEQQQVSALPGQTVSATCRVEANPEAEVAWQRRDGEEVLSHGNIRINQKRDHEKTVGGPGEKQQRILTSSLTIEDISLEQMLDYVCVATNSVGAANATVNVTLSTPPLITRQARRKIYYMDLDFKGRSTVPITLDCEATGSPTPSYRWTKDGEPLFWEADDRMSLDPESGSLLIENLKEHDNGWYQCIAYNELGVAKSTPIQVLDTTMAKFIEPTPTLELDAEEGRPFNMSCAKANGDPEPMVLWVVAYPPNAEGLLKVNFLQDVSNRTVQGPDGVAYFSHITKEDDSFANNISYICAARQMVTATELTMGLTIKIRVVPPKDGGENATVRQDGVDTFVMHSSPENVTLKGDEKNMLWCIFGGAPVPNITWSRVDGQPLGEHDYEVLNNNATLVINKTNMSHAVSYRCSASNGGGRSVSRTIKVAVDMPPVFTDTLKSHTVAPGTKVIFACSVNGSGVIVFRWTHNGRPIPPEDSNRLMEGSSLVVKSATHRDIGNYACNATSVYGYAYGQSTLNVIGGHKYDRSGSEGCPEVKILRDEIAELRKNLQEMNEFMEITRLRQETSNLQLIQRIAAKLNVLTEQEKRVYSSYHKEEVGIETKFHENPDKSGATPEFLFAENVGRNKTTAATPATVAEVQQQMKAEEVTSETEQTKPEEESVKDAADSESIQPADADEKMVQESEKEIVEKS